MARLLPSVIAALLPMLVLWGCGGASSSPGGDFGRGDTITSEASCLRLVRCDGYTAAEIFVPWTGDSVPLTRLAVVDSGRDASAMDFGPGVTVVQAPLRRSVVFSGVHTSAIAELGAIGAVSAVADGSFFLPGDTVAALIASGRVADVGSSLSPLVEKIVDISPDAILLSPYQDGGPADINGIGAPVIPMADYLERTPLGRAEWIKLIGALYGRADSAAAVYDRVAERYADVRARALAAPGRPVVITEMPASGVWYVPGGGSYMACLLRDAGASYPWADNSDSGSLPLDEAAVIDRGGDARYWLVKTFGDLSRASMLGRVPHAGAFAAFPDGVYVCDTSVKPYYDCVAFHPERILAEFAAIFHPEAVADSDSTARFFEPLR